MRAGRASITAIASSLALVATPAAAQQAADVEVVDNAYRPADVTVDAGGTVTWSQTGSLPHSVTADDGSFDSHPDCGAGGACMGTGDTFQRTFDQPGTYAYYCRIHGGPGGAGMAGTVVVLAAQTEEPTTAPTTEPTDEPTAAEPTTGPTAEPTDDEPVTEEPTTDEPAADTGDAATDAGGDDAAAEAEAPSLAETGTPAVWLVVLGLLTIAVGATTARAAVRRSR